jgi:hypothetical protein
VQFLASIILWPVSVLSRIFARMTLAAGILILTTTLSLIFSTALLSSAAFSSFAAGALSRIGFTTVYQSATLKVDRLAKQNATLVKQRQDAKVAAKRTRKNILKRARKNVVRNIAMMPAESLPVLGVGVIVGLTALEVNDMCAIVEDIDALMGDLEVEIERSKSEQLCLSWRSSLDETTTQVKDESVDAWETVTEVGEDTREVLMKACRSYGICNN